MKSIVYFISIVLLSLAHNMACYAQQKKILVDVGHGQKFYSDPADNISSDLVPAERLKYMTGELAKNASAHNAAIGYVKAPITKEALAKSDLLFIHTPSKQYSPDECAAIREFVNGGGSLFIVMEVDYWSTLA